MEKNEEKMPGDSEDRSQRRWCIYSVYVAGAMEPEEAMQTARQVEPGRLDTAWLDIQKPQAGRRKRAVKLNS